MTKKIEISALGKTAVEKKRLPRKKKMMGVSGKKAG